jgi:hypothetical protein
MASGPRVSVAPWIGAAVGYTALIVFFTWPLAVRMKSVLPHDLGDPLFGAYLLWWNAHAVPLTERWWNAPFFWPTNGAMGLSEHLLGLSVIASPLQWLGVDAISTYNILFILSFPLAALGAHALAFRLIGRHDAATLAGLLFGFSPYRTAQISHIQMLWTFWMPVALLALHQYATDGRKRWLALFGAMWLGQAASNGYFLLFLPVLVGCWLLWFFLLRGDVRRVLIVIGASAAATIPLAPVLLGYRRIHDQLSLERTFGEIREYSADVMGFLTTAPSLWAWTRFSEVHRAEQEIFTGLVPVVLVAAACALSLGRGRTPKSLHPRVQRGFIVLSGAAAAVAAAAWLFGPWVWAAGDVTLLSVSTPMKPLTVAIWSAMGAFIASGTARRMASSQSLFGFYVAASIAMYVLCLGPEPAVNGFRFWYKGPYSLLMELPGYSAIRVPSRFAALGTLCLAVASALALVRLTSGLSARVSHAVRVGVCGLALADCWMFNIVLPPIPARIPTLEAQASDNPVIELPIGDVGRDLAAMYHSTFSRHRVVNGYAGFSPAPNAVLRLALDEGDISALDALDVALTAAVDPRADDRQWRGFTPQLDTAVVDPASGWKIFTVPKPPPPPDKPRGARLPIRGATASVDVDLASVTDGDPISHWDSAAPQSGGEWIAFDLGSTRDVDGLMLAIGPAFGGYARSIAIDVSTDGDTWTTVLETRSAAAAIIAAREDPRLGPVTYAFPPSPARWVRARQLGGADLFHWSICEAAVFGR